jgi:hypothetical protein
MKTLIAVCLAVTMILALSGVAQAGTSWIHEPALGYNAYYNGNYIVETTTGTVVIPYDDPGYPPYTTGTTQTAFTVGQSVFTASAIALDVGHTYNWAQVFQDNTTLGRSVTLWSGTWTDQGEGYVFLWGAGVGPSDGVHLGGLADLDVGNWTYTETWTDVAGGTPLVYTQDFTVAPVPEPLTMGAVFASLCGLGAYLRKRTKTA